MPDEEAPAVSPRRPAKRKLTRKQEKLARAMVKDPNASLSQLADAAGYEGPTKSVKAVSVWKAGNLPHVKARVRELMETSPKLNVPALLTKLEEGLEATDTKFFAHKGKVVSKRETVDYATRKGYLDTALEMQGVKEKVDGGVTNNFFTKDAIEAFVAAFKRQAPIDAEHT